RTQSSTCAGKDGVLRSTCRSPQCSIRSVLHDKASKNATHLVPHPKGTTHLSQDEGEMGQGKSLSLATGPAVERHFPAHQEHLDAGSQGTEDSSSRNQVDRDNCKLR